MWQFLPGEAVQLRTAVRRAQILVIAVLMKAVMQRTFNVFQWEALVLLVAGITVNQLKHCTCVCLQNSHALWLVSWMRTELRVTPATSC